MVPRPIKSLFKNPYPEKNTNFHNTPFTYGGNAHGNIDNDSKMPDHFTSTFKNDATRYPIKVVKTTINLNHFKPI